MRPLTIAIVVALVLGLASQTLAGEATFKIIVNPKNPIGSIRRDFLREAFLKKEETWSDGDTIRPIVLSSRFPVRDQFTRDVLKKTPAQLRTYWNQQIFSGKGVPPPETDSTDSLIAYVLANPGAVGYIPSDADPHGAKVIGLE